MKKANKKFYLEPTIEAPSRIIPPIEKSLPMPERIITNGKNDMNYAKKSALSNEGNTLDVSVDYLPGRTDKPEVNK